MAMLSATESSDPLLLPFLHAVDAAEAESYLAQLISEHAAPVIKSIVQRRLGVYGSGISSYQSEEAEDVYDEALLQLIAHLNDFKCHPTGKSISDFLGYAAVIAHNACHHYLRQKYPQRSRLKNRIRYLLTHRKEFFLGEEDTASADQQSLCGLTAWRGEKRAPARPEQLQQLRDNPQLLEQVGLKARNVQGARLDDLLTAIFKWVSGLVELDALVNTVANLQGIKDQAAYAETDAEWAATLTERLPDPRADVAGEVERRLYLRQLWAEICQLPPRQRIALLLNLRDGQEEVISLLLLTGAATLRQIAEATGTPLEQFAELWRRLPLDDLTIAARLGVTRQQVINLRKAARERLGRRMKAFG